MMRQAVDIPAEYIFDNREGGVALAQFFDGVYFGSVGIVGVVWAEDTIDLIKEIPPRYCSLCWYPLLKENEIVDVDIGITETLVSKQGWNQAEVCGEL